LKLAENGGRVEREAVARNQLILVDATFELLDAAIEDQLRLGRLLGAAVADGWAGFPESMVVLRSWYGQGRSASRWGTLLLVLTEPKTLVGLGGYKGGPSPEGVVEIGYAIAPFFRGRGLATEAVRQMVDRAFDDPRVVAVEAHTLAHPNPSTRVLEKAGFDRVGEHQDREDGPIWQWRRRRPATTG
jgi:RimJ/RimL family protein N-acetyltransferase